MTPDTKVWIASARAGIAYHLVNEAGRKTVCGRYIGAGPGKVERGYVQLLAWVVEAYASKPCRTCIGSQERVQPIIRRST